MNIKIEMTAAQALELTCLLEHLPYGNTDFAQGVKPRLDRLKESIINQAVAQMSPDEVKAAIKECEGYQNPFCFPEIIE